MRLSQAPYHCLAWIDHSLARIYAVKRDEIREIAVVHAPDRGRGHVHHHVGTPGPGHEPPAQEFLDKVVVAIGDAAEVLIAGPGEAKHALKRHAWVHAPRLASRIVGVETIAACGVRELHAFANRLFRRADRMGAPPA